MSTFSRSFAQPAPRRITQARCPGPLGACCALALVLLAGCGPVRLVATTNIPTPLVVKIPVAIALLVPKEFSEYAHEEERWGTKWQVQLGQAQTDGITRLMSAMFERVVTVDSLAAGAGLGPQVRAILEPSIEEYAFVTPRDAGSQFFAVSIKYRMNVYLPDGKLADSWGFTGYGTSVAKGLASTPALAAATALAMRDAGAKLAVEFREQAVVRGLFGQTETAETPSQGATAPAAGGVSEQPPEPPQAPAAASVPASGGRAPAENEAPPESAVGGSGESTPPASAGPSQGQESATSAPVSDDPASKDSPPPEAPDAHAPQLPPVTPPTEDASTDRPVREDEHAGGEAPVPEDPPQPH